MKVGHRTPYFRLKDQDGNNVSSAARLAQRPLVVAFYRGVWCPWPTDSLRTTACKCGFNRWMQHT
ncbi:redoxin family protein [Paraburkholderia sp. GAS334]|uniref:redoxin family protein n=1 Tax=Paraburkholderia sp. GAS334 TaxID=3035131 RepID=UPI003D21F63F